MASNTAKLWADLSVSPPLCNVCSVSEMPVLLLYAMRGVRHEVRVKTARQPPQKGFICSQTPDEREVLCIIHGL